MTSRVSTKRLSSALARILAFALLASTLSVVPFIPEAEAQANPTWDCDGIPILMRGGQFNLIVPDPAVPGNLTIQPVPGTSGIWNSTAHDPINGWVYGVGTIGGEKYVRAYDANGATVFDTQISAPYPDNAGTYAGTVLGDGRYIIHSVGAGNGNGWYNGARFNLWAVDPLTGAATHVGSTPVNFADFAYNPLDGYLYQAVNRVLYRVDPNTGATTSAPTSAVLPNGGFGASWFDSSGNIYLFRNNPGDIWKIDPNNPQTVVEVGEVGANGGTDGTNCISSIDITKDVVDGAGNAILPGDRVYSPGDTVTYKFTLINNGLPTQNRTVDLCDVLPADGRTYTGTWSSTDPGATVTSGGAAGDTSVCLEVDMPSSLWTDPANPGSPPTEVTIDVILDEDMIPGIYENQATLDFDQDGTVDLNSDDPGDGSDPRDPTTIIVEGGFVVQKRVDGHPVDNNTDSFAVTLSCAAADGSGLTVDGTDIVDDATGNQWPGATQNSFDISNGDRVRVTGLPAGATCVTTEAASTAYGTTVVSSEGTSGLSATTVIDEAISDEFVGFTNETGTLTLSKATTATGAIPLEEDDTFTFDISCSNGFSDTISLTTTDGSASIGYPDIPLIGDGAECTISETVPDGWELTSDNDVEVTIASGTTPGAAFENERQLADLTIVKDIIGLPEGSDPASLVFEVTAECTGGFDPDPYSVTGDFGLGSPLVIEDLPVGAVCTVTETPADGFNTRYEPGQTVTVEDGGTDVLVTNSTGALIIEKTTSAPSTHPVDPTGTFEFLLECTGPGGTFTETFSVDAITLVSGGATGGVSHTEIGVLAPGTTCDVTEAASGGGGGGGGSGATSTGTPAGTTLVSDNCQDGAGFAPFNLQVRNTQGSTVNWEMIWRDRPYSTIPSLNPGPYTHAVVPTVGGLFDHVFTGTTPLSPYSNVTITGGLPDPAGDNSCASVEHYLDGTGVPTGGPAADEEWTNAGSATVTVEITEDDPEPTAAFLNVRNVGSLTVEKTLEGVPAGVDLGDEPFTVDISCTGGFTVDPYLISGQTVTANTPLVIDDLPTGTECTVTEQPDPRFMATGSPSTVTIDSDGETVELTNTTSSIEFQKRTTSGALVDNVDGTFDFTIVCTFGGNEVANTTTSITTVDGIGTAGAATLPLVPPGSTCTITETVPPGWTITQRVAPTQVGTDGIQFTTPLASNVGFQNTLDTETLTITKDVTGVAATPALEAETFTVSVECTGNFTGGTASFGPLSVTEGTPVDIDGLPIGAECTVTETADGRFTTTYDPGDTIIIVDGDNDVTIENETSTFTISKATTVPAGVDPDATFDFAIECLAGGSVVYSDTVSITTTGGTGDWDVGPFLAPGTECTITETAPTGWTTDGPAAITITTEGPSIVDAPFVNVRDVADLTITKTLLGPGSDAFSTEPFTVDVTCVGDFASSPLVVTDVEITAVTPGVVPDLPTGAVCTVTEDFDSRFQTLYAPDIGDGTAAEVTIGTGGTEAGITNVTGTLAIAKSTIGPAQHGEDLLVDIDYVFDCDTLAAPFTRTLSVADLSGGQGIGVLTFTDLPTMANGTICEVTEIVPPGWTVTSPNPQQLIAEVDPEYATFTNERDTGGLTISKVLDGVPAGTDLGDEPFTVDITCTGGFTTNPYVISGETITENTPLVISDLPTGAVCSVTETADPRFTSAITAPVTIDEDGEAITVTNTTSTFSISKATTGPVTHPVDLDATFTFAVECVDGAGAPIYSGTETVTTSGQSGTWATPDTPLLPPGTECSVTEQAPPTGWTNTSGTVVDITTDSTAIENAAFTNARETDSLTINKTVIGSPTDLGDEPFTVDISCTGGFTVDPYLITGVVVTENTPIVIDDLPTGAACTVTEQPDARFLPSYGPDDATAIIGEDGSTVDVDNRTGTFSVIKNVDVAGTQPIDLSGSFVIDVSCTDGTDFSLNMDVIDGVPVTAALPDVPLLPDGTACTVTEATPPVGWTLSTPNDIEVIVNSESEPVVSFTNTRDTGDLNVTKTVIGAPDGLDVPSLVFTVDVTCTGDFDTSPLVFADQEIRHGETLTFPDLPTGAVCTVVEDPDPRFAASTTPIDAGTAGVTIDADGEDVALVNATGEIMIVKNTQVPSGFPVDVTESFDFTVDCGAAHTGDYTVVASTVTSSTTATGFLRFSDIPALPDGTTCTVTEQAAPTGWTLVSPNDVPLTVDSDGVVTATFTNQRDIGTLTIEKILDGVPAGTDLDAELFDVTITCTGGFTTATHEITGQISVDVPLLVPELPTGTECSVEEDADPRFSTTVGADVVVETTGGTIEVTNTTSTLSITKTTTGPGTHPLDLDATFTFDVECTNDADEVLFSGTQTITTDAQTGTWATPATPLLPPGTECTVTENATTGWTVAPPNPVVVTTDSADIVDAAFENSRDTGAVTINKILEGVPAGTDLDDQLFDVTVTCTGGFTTATHVVTGEFSVDQPLTITDLPTNASCSAVETPVAQFATTTSGVVTVTQLGESIDITNTTSTLAIVKTTTGPTTQPIVLDGTFVFDTECVDPGGVVLFSGTQTITTDAQTGTWATPATPLLPPGTECTVTEQTPPTGWTNTSGLTTTITTDADEITEAEFVNNRDTSDLNITKTVIGAPDDLDVPSLVFTVDVTCTGDFDTSPLTFLDQPISDGGTVTIADLPTGAVCTVIEDADPRFQTTVTPVDAGTAGVTLDSDGEDVALVNATGEIMIVKNTQVPSAFPVDVTESFDFVVDCGATYSGTHTVVADTVTSSTTATGFLRYSDIPALPNDTDCTVTEQAPPTGWTLVSPNDVPLTVDSDGVVTATFTNQRDIGTLTIEKILDGVPAGTDLDAELFDVTITCTGGFTTATHEITGQFSVDAPLSITGLPTGTECSAVETADPRFSTTTGPDQTVTTGDVEIEITNTTSTLSITKTTTGPATHPLDLDDTFTFDVECTNPGGDVLFSGTQTITTDAQTGTWATPATPLLPPGTECTVTENATTGWTIADPNPVVVTTDSDGIVDAPFENSRDTAPITINKILEGVPAGTDLDAELFDVTVTCTGGFTTATHVVTGEISVDASLTISDLPTGTECSTTETADPRFSTAIGSDVVINTSDNSVDVTNTTSTFSIVKTTTGPTTHPLDLDDTFVFDTECVNGAGTVLFSGTQTITTDAQTGTWATPATPLLPPGTECTITEQTPPTGWTNTSGLTTTITTDADEITEAEFVNDRDVETLTISKQLLGVPEGIDLSDALFDVTVTCSNGFTVTEHVVTGQISSIAPLEIPDLPTGAVCEVQEASDARFFTIYSPPNGTGDAATATIADGDNDVLVTNSTGAVIVAKETVVSPTHPIDPVADFTFTIDCGAVYNADHTLTTDLLTATGATGVIFYTDLPLVPEGTVCNVTELDETPEWTLTTDRTVTLTASSENPVTAQFINERSLGSLSINKIIEGPEGDDLSAEEFEVTVTCSGGFTEDPYVLTGTISEISSYAISDLPYGAECSVEETPNSQFASSIAAPTATITDTAAEVDVLNQTGRLEIDIDAVVNSVFPLDPDDDFVLVLVATLPDGTTTEITIDITTVDGDGVWQSDLFPTGTVFNVQLEASDEWDLIGRDGNPVGANGIEVTVGTDVAVIGFDLERALTSLTVDKVLENIPAGADYDDFAFDVTITCTDGFQTEVFELPGAFTVSSTTPLVIVDLPVSSSCEIVEADNEFFEASYSPTNTVTLVEADASNEMTITNTGNDALADEFAPEPSGPLALTGRTVGSLVWIAVLMLAGGMFLLIGARRKEDEAS